MGNLPLAKIPYLLLGGGLPGIKPDPGHDFLAKVLVRHAEYRYLCHLRVGKEELLDLPGGDIFTAADDDFLLPPCDPYITIFVHGAQVPRMKPAVFVNCLSGCLRVAVIAFRDVVAPEADLADLSQRHSLFALGIDNLHLLVGQILSDRFKAHIHRVFARCQVGKWGGLRHAVADENFGAGHLLDYTLDQRWRAGSSGHNACAQSRKIKFLEAGMLQLSDEHGGNTVDGGALFLLGSLKHLQGIEILAGKDHAGPHGKTEQTGQGYPETVIKGDRDAEAVLLGKIHGHGGGTGVVEQVVMGEDRCFWKAEGARGV